MQLWRTSRRQALAVFGWALGTAGWLVLAAAILMSGGFFASSVSRWVALGPMPVTGLRSASVTASRRGVPAGSHAIVLRHVRACAEPTPEQPREVIVTAAERGSGQPLSGAQVSAEKQGWSIMTPGA